MSGGYAFLQKTCIRYFDVGVRYLLSEPIALWDLTHR